MPDQDRVVVPDFVGKAVHVANDEAAEKRILLTSHDLDGPSLHARTWPGLFWVTGQDVPAGSLVESWSRVVVTYVAAGGTQSAVGVAPSDPPPTLSAYAEPEDDAVDAREWRTEPKS